MTTRARFLSVRLVTVGYASLALIVWIACVPGALFAVDVRDGDVRLTPAIISGCFSLSLLVILSPVFRLGPRRDRWLAVIAALFPVLVLVVTGMRLLRMAF
jgi:hypothetical protein